MVEGGVTSLFFVTLILLLTYREEVVSVRVARRRAGLPHRVVYESDTSLFAMRPQLFPHRKLGFTDAFDCCQTGMRGVEEIAEQRLLCRRQGEAERLHG